MLCRTAEKLKRNRGWITESVTKVVLSRKYFSILEADGGHQNPLVQALIVSNHLQIPPKLLNRNYPQHQPINPYVALLLSHYGKYVPVYGNGRGLYAYNAANDYHNNRPFGSYKVHEDQRR